jgi:uncharacterized protein (DUF885 family)
MGIRKSLSVLCIVLGAVGCATPGATPGAAPAPTTGDSLIAIARLRVALVNQWENARVWSPQDAAWSDPRITRLQDVSYNGAKAQASYARAATRALYDIRVDALPEDLYVSWLVLEWDAAIQARYTPYYWTDLSTISPSRSPLRISLDLLQHDSLADSADVRRHVALVGAYGTLVDSIRSGLAARTSRGITLSRPLVPDAVRFVRSLIAPADSSPFLPSPARLEALDSSGRARLQERVRQSITSRVNPALERLAAYLTGDYAAHASDRMGLWQYPAGQQYYRFLVRSYSTLDIAPEEAHAVGLHEVARLDSLVAQRRSASGLPADHDSLLARLKSDPRYAVISAGTVVDHLVAEYQQTALVLGKAFSRSPELSTDIQAMSPGLEEGGELAFYQPVTVADPQGHYFFNTARWRARTIFTLPARVYEDLMPGRHYQAALQRENADLPVLRRVVTHAGYVDGWSTYAIGLADSLRADADPAHHLAALYQELAHACGLVVDTGINYFGWTHDQAMAFLRTRLPENDDELERDILRPALELPGSLTAATLGARELRGMRRWAEKELGDRFDLRAFHDEVLSLGSVPLPVLGTHLEWWLWRERSKPTAPKNSPLP